MTSPTSGNAGLPHAISGLSSASSLSTPLPKPRPEESLSALFEDAGFSPPEKADILFKSAVVSRAQEVLTEILKKWTDLDATQQVKLAFLIMHGQENHVFAVSSANETAQILWKACTDESHHCFAKLDAYVRKGGDYSWVESSKFNLDGLHVDPFSDFVNDQDQEKVATLFVNNPNVEGGSIEPVLRLQEDKSTICYIVSVVTAIYYSQCYKHGGTQNDGVKIRSLNVNRFMRNYFSDEEIFQNIFGNQGGWPHIIIGRLLGASNPGKKRLSLTKDFEPIDESDVNLIFGVIKKNLMAYGALIIDDFLIFQEFLDEETLKFSGDWKDKEQRSDLPPHAILVVGARLTGDPSEMGGLALLLQNSWKGKPFVVVGYDLLKSMGIAMFMVINKGLNFIIPDNCSMDGEPSNSTMSGSPHELAESPDCFISESVRGKNIPPHLLFPGNGSIVSEPVSSSSFPPPLTDASYYWNVINPNEKPVGEVSFVGPSS